MQSAFAAAEQATVCLLIRLISDGPYLISAQAVLNCGLRADLLLADLKSGQVKLDSGLRIDYFWHLQQGASVTEDTEG